MEIHGLKLYFRREKTQSEQCTHDDTTCGKAPAKTQGTNNRSAQSRPPRKSHARIELEERANDVARRG